MGKLARMQTYRLGFGEKNNQVHSLPCLNRETEHQHYAASPALSPDSSLIY